MLNLWTHASSHSKFMFWILNAMFVAMWVMAIILVGTTKGLPFIVERLTEWSFWSMFIKFHCLLPLMPTLLIVLLSGWSHLPNSMDEMEA